MWQQAVVAYSGNYSEICLEGLRKTTKNLSQDSRQAGRQTDRQTDRQIDR
jgi:hypothetical protein